VSETSAPAEAILNDNRRRDLFERVWGFVRDTHADPELGGLDWETVQNTYLPRAVGAPSDAALYEVLDEVVGLLGDGASDFLTPDEAAQQDAAAEAEAGLGLLVRPAAEGGLLVLYVAPGGPAAEAGVRQGARIVALDGNGDPSPAALLGDAGSTLTLELASEEQLTLTRRAVPPARPVTEVLEGGAAYVRLPSVSAEAVGAFGRAQLGAANGLVLDLRGSAGELEEVGQLARLLGLERLGQRRSRAGTETLPVPARASSTTALAETPLVVLADEHLSPYVHLLAAALKAQGRAAVVGARLGPAFSVRAYNLFAGGSRLLLADAELLLPDGSPACLTPDVPVSADWLRVPRGEDPYVLAATELLRAPVSRRTLSAAGASAVQVSLRAPTAVNVGMNAGEVMGDLKAWHPVTVRWRGPAASEAGDDPNPFLDYRLQVRFTGPSGQRYDVPGFFNGDGEGGGEGDIWQVTFAPDEAGRWRYEASFREGPEVAVDLAPEAGTPTAFDGSSGTLTVAAPDPSTPGFKGKGRLGYAGGHYLRHADGSYFLKVGLDEPENWLAYEGFDNTSAPGSHPLHDYESHVPHWRPGDPSWEGEQGTELGKGIIGWLNYMRERGLNSMYFLPMNIGGDGQDTWPFVGPISSGRAGHEDNDNTHYDLSKLRQWDIVFGHAQDLGILLHVVLGEGETANKAELGFDLTTERKLFYRELVARFGYHNALRWNLSEEYNSENAGDVPLTPEQIVAFADYLKAVDPYGHAVTVHNWAMEGENNSTGAPITWESAFRPFLGDERFSTTSIQVYPDEEDLDVQAERYRTLTAAHGRPLPLEFDEFRRVTSDEREQEEMRKRYLWPILLSGGQLEWIIKGEPRGVNVNDLTPYDALWRWSGYAQRFLSGLPFWEMGPQDALLTGAASYGDTTAQVFSKPGEAYAIYLPDGSESGTLDLGGDPGTFELRWFNPRTGSFEGGASRLEGGASVTLGTPPAEAHEDWVVLLEGV